MIGVIFYVLEKILKVTLGLVDYDALIYLSINDLFVQLFTELTSKERERRRRRRKIPI